MLCFSCRLQCTTFSVEFVLKDCWIIVGLVNFFISVCLILHFCKNSFISLQCSISLHTAPMWTNCCPNAEQYGLHLDTFDNDVWQNITRKQSCLYHQLLFSLIDISQLFCLLQTRLRLVHYFSRNFRKCKNCPNAPQSPLFWKFGHTYAGTDISSGRASIWCVPLIK